jgi:hypothetical protein
MAIPGIVGGLGQIFAGHGASKAAGAASNYLAGGANEASGQYRQGMDTGNQYLQDASGNAIDWAAKAGDWAQGTALDTAGRTSQDVSDRAAAAAAGVNTATTGANQFLDPYTQAGKGALTQIGDLANQQFKFSQDDPSYQWRLQQGQQALERSAAARGGSLGGAAAKAMARYGQGAASTEYGAAFDRFQTNRAHQLQALGGLAQLGYGAAGQSGQNLIGAGKYGGDVSMQAGMWGGNARNRAAEYAGNAGMQTAQYGGNIATQTARDLASNERWGWGNMADMTLARANAQAGGVLGQQAGKNQMWSGLGQTLMAGAQGAFGGGGGAFGPTAANMPDTSAVGGGIPMSSFPQAPAYTPPTVGLPPQANYSGGPWSSPIQWS